MGNGQFRQFMEFGKQFIRRIFGRRRLIRRRRSKRVMVTTNCR
jgi:hypothetical protein